MNRLRAWLGPLRPGSGPAVASLFHRLFGLITLAAWWSLGRQVRVLIGSRGLQPVTEFVAGVQLAQDLNGVHLSFFDVPTVFRWFHSDAVLVGGTWVGAALAMAAVVGWRPRLCFGLSTALYLSYATVARELLSFQWDNLLLECGLLATFLPRRRSNAGTLGGSPHSPATDSAGRSPAPSTRSAPLVHFLFRAVLFKLYFESGVAKWQSPIHDWQDGSAMTTYYETAPLPTWIGVFAHHLPVWWHHFESRAVLVLELLVPLFIFGPRRLRLAAAITFGFFQIGNAATANYGFFCYLAAVLNLFLLDDADVERAAGWIPERWRRFLRRSSSASPPASGHSPGPEGLAPVLRWAARAGAGLWLLVSLIDALLLFTEPGRGLSLVAPLLELNERFRLVNSYHLFASVTRERIEPQFETTADGNGWTERDLRYKAGDPRRAPGFVAPHQPRLDFQLWFYGLAFRRREPSYVSALVRRLCSDPAAVQPLFRDPLPPHPLAVRIVYWQYHFASAAERRATGDWWRRARIAESRAIPCAGLAPPAGL